MKFEMQNVYDYIDQHADEYVEFLRTLVRQPSIADTGEGIREMVRCKALGPGRRRLKRRATLSSMPS